MTGITKDELMQMAREAGLSFLDGSARAEIDDYIDEELIAFSNSILERAAVEYDKAVDSAKSLEKICDEMGDYGASSAAASESWASEKNAASIRALKIKTGD